MNLKEARDILEISSTATPEEAKKKYRKLTKEYHPDINKEPGAEDKFKKINEAYQCVSSGKGTDREDLHWQNHHASNPFDPFGRQTFHQAEHIDINTTISFKDSVIGCKKELKFNRKTKCRDCNGQGQITLNNGCDKCGGKGQIMSQKGGMIFVQTCDKCYGRSQTDPCNSCKQQGVVDAEVSINVSIPGGIQNSNILRLGGMGHFVGNFGPMEQHTDVHLHINVNAEPGLTLEGLTVMSNISISLLEALQGCKKTVNTIMGSKEININPKSKNKDEIIIPRFGVNRSGDQKVILEVMYPENINALVDVLSKERLN